MDEKHIYTTVRMPVDPEKEKNLVYVQAYTPRMDKSNWKRVNYDITWFKKNILCWYYQKLRYFLNKNISEPREMTIQADICIKDNMDEINRLLTLSGVRIILTKPEYIKGFENGKKIGGKK